MLKVHFLYPSTNVITYRKLYPSVNVITYRKLYPSINYYYVPEVIP